MAAVGGRSIVFVGFMGAGKSKALTEASKLGLQTFDADDVIEHQVGCSIGVLTRALAARCDALLALDVAGAALDQARRLHGELGRDARWARVPAAARSRPFAASHLARGAPAA